VKVLFPIRKYALSNQNFILTIFITKTRDGKAGPPAPWRLVSWFTSVIALHTERYKSVVGDTIAERRDRSGAGDRECVWVEVEWDGEGRKPRCACAVAVA